MYYVEIGCDRLYCINLSENKKKSSATENTVVSHKSRRISGLSERLLTYQEYLSYIELVPT